MTKNEKRKPIKIHEHKTQKYKNRPPTTDHRPLAFKSKSIIRCPLSVVRCLILCLCVLVSLVGCYKSPLPITELSEAHEKFEQICEEDYNLKPVIQHFPNTMYVYVPIHFDLLKTNATKVDPFENPQSDIKRQINFIETTFSNEQFSIQYDISNINIYPKILGYGSAYTDRFSALHNNLLSSLSRAYGDLDDDQIPMNFIIIMIIDVRNGIGIKSTFYFKDLQMVMTQALPQGEYAKRYMTEMVGDENFVDNALAKNLDFHDITWPEFIAKQITYRINFKYGRSSFPPSESDTKEILSIVYDATRAYDFEDFEKVKLKNLADENVLLFDKEQLETFK